MPAFLRKFSGSFFSLGIIACVASLLMLSHCKPRRTGASNSKDVFADAPEYSSVKLSMLADEKTGEIVATFNTQGSPFKSGDEVTLVWDVLRGKFDVNCSQLRNREAITIPAGQNQVRISFKTEPTSLQNMIEAPKTVTFADDRQATKYQHFVGAEKFQGNAVVEGCLMIPGVGIASRADGVPEEKIPDHNQGFALNDSDASLPANIRYAERCAQAIGYVKPFSCIDAGVTVPITKDGVVQNSIPDKCDREVYLEGPDRCSVNTRVGRIPLYTDKTYTTVKENVSAVYFCRHYSDSSLVSVPGEANSSGPNFPYFADVAIIMQDHATGKTCYFQALGPGSQEALYGRRVPPPTETKEEWNTNVTQEDKNKGAQPSYPFWLPPSNIAHIHCISCHDNDPFMHSPWIDQKRVLNSSGQPTNEPLVPTQPFLDYVVVGKDFGFENWDTAYHFELPDNACTQCHRISSMKTCRSWIQDAYPVHTAGNAPATSDFYVPDRLSQKGLSHSFHHWMPPPPRSAGGIPAWEESLPDYEESVAQLRKCCDLTLNGKRILGYGKINQPFGHTLSQQELDFLSQNGCPVERHSSVVDR